MKLKPIIASLMLLGLAAPAFADAPATTSTQAQLDAMKAQLNKMEAIINQNNNGGFQQVADWTSRITVSGMMNIDGYMSNTTSNFGLVAANPGTTGGSTNNMAINNANIFVDALVNDWTNIHIGLAASSNYSNSFSREPNPNSQAFDEGYVTIGNFAQSPFYFRAGREYLPFGQYDRYPMFQNPTQLLTETSSTAAQVGFVSPVGVYGSVYALDGLNKSSEPSSRARVQNWGANLGYGHADNTMGFKFDAGYLNNMADVNYIADGLNNNAGQNDTYATRVGGVALSLDANASNFDVALRYVTALKDFASDNVQYNDSGARPSAYGAEVGFSFPVVAHQSRIDFGYQHSNQASSNNITFDANGDQTGNTNVGRFGLPQNRYYGNYTVNVSKWTDIGVGVYYDRDYSIGNGGTGKTATTGIVQLGVKFA